MRTQPETRLALSLQGVGVNRLSPSPPDSSHIFSTGDTDSGSPNSAIVSISKEPAVMSGKSVNKVILVGNLGKDPEMKFTQGGMPVAKFTLATNERQKDKDGQWQDRTEWHNLVAFQRTAEIVGEYLKKGRQVYIEGSLRTGSWEDKETGKKMYKTEILVNDLVLLGGGRGEGGGEHTGSS